jgi:hypothetical protein
LFDQGNRLYQAEDFAGARQAYEAVMEAGFESAALYYNLGNAAIRTDDLGRAIWAYARAERLSPADPDVRSNLAYARARTRDTVGVKDESRLLRLLAGVSSGWSAAAQGRSALVLYWLLSATLIVRLLLPRLRRWTRIALWAGAVLLVLDLTVTGLGQLASSGTRAVVLAAELSAQGGPSEAGRALFTLHAGTEVRVARRLGGWVEISLGNDLKGWVPENAIAVI